MRLARYRTSRARTFFQCVVDIALTPGVDLRKFPCGSGQYMAGVLEVSTHEAAERIPVATMTLVITFLVDRTEGMNITKAELIVDRAFREGHDLESETITPICRVTTSMQTQRIAMEIHHDQTSGYQDG